MYVAHGIWLHHVLRWQLTNCPPQKINPNSVFKIHTKWKVNTDPNWVYTVIVPLAYTQAE